MGGRERRAARGFPSSRRVAANHPAAEGRDLGRGWSINAKLLVQDDSYWLFSGGGRGCCNVRPKLGLIRQRRRSHKDGSPPGIHAGGGMVYASSPGGGASQPHVIP